MRVVLRESACTRHALHDTGLLVAVDGAELEESQWQLAVGPATRVEDEIVHGAVHRLEVVVRPLPTHVPGVIDVGIELHRRVHPLGVPVEVPGLLEEGCLGDVRGVDEFIAGLFVAAPRVVLHDPAHDPALGMEHREARADLLGEAEEVHLRAKLAMVALLSLLQEGEVGLQLLLVRPRRAVDALQLVL